MQPWDINNARSNVPSLFSMPPPPNGMIPPPLPQFSLNNFPSSNAAQPTNRPVAQDAAAVNRHFTSDRFPGAPNSSISGHGKLTWLSSRAGVITCDDGKSISFQNKEFTDQGVNELSSLLRVGFTLDFKASAGSNAAVNQYMASRVKPIYGEESKRIFANEEEIDLEAHNPTIPYAKDQYSVALELRAIETLLRAFHRLGESKLALGAIHNHMSSYQIEDETIYRYVGTSSMKRRQWVQQRTHALILYNDDTIELQHPSIYDAVVMMTSYLLRHGGVTSVQSMYEHFFIENDVDRSVRDAIAHKQCSFVDLLAAHPFAFALFPDKLFVSARRNLPDFDYQGFIRGNFSRMLDPQQNYDDQQTHHQNDNNREPQRFRPAPLINNPLYVPPPQPQNRQYEQDYINARNVPNVDPRYRVNGMTVRYDQYVAPQPPTIPAGDNYEYAFLTGSRTNGGPKSRQASPDSTMFADFQSEFSTKLTLNDGSKKVQQPIGCPGCTCKCNCGAAQRATNRPVGAIGSNRVSAKSNGVTLPTIYPGVNGLGSSIGPIGSRRPSSISTVSSSEEPAPSTGSTYTLFGTENLFGSSFGFNFNYKK